jgi:hypothetical protein
VPRFGGAFFLQLKIKKAAAAAFFAITKTRFRRDGGLPFYAVVADFPLEVGL